MALSLGHDTLQETSEAGAHGCGSEGNLVLEGSASSARRCQWRGGLSQGGGVERKSTEGSG